MSAKIVSYDVDQTVPLPTCYKDISDMLESYTHAKITQSCWVIDTRESCRIIHRKLKRIMNSQDRLFVADLGENVKCHNIIDKDAFN